MIDYNTHNLILINYPTGAGGRFISYCLSLHPRVLSLNNQESKTQQFDQHLQVLKHNATHSNHREIFEDDCPDTTQTPSDFFAAHTNQTDLFLIKTVQNVQLNTQYPNAKNIVLCNTQQILQKRLTEPFADAGANVTLGEARHSWWQKHVDSIDQTVCLFDMSTVNNAQLFLAEIETAIHYCIPDSTDKIDTQILEQYRTLFNQDVAHATGSTKDLLGEQGL